MVLWFALRRNVFTKPSRDRAGPHDFRRGLGRKGVLGFVVYCDPRRGPRARAGGSVLLVRRADAGDPLLAQGALMENRVSIDTTPLLSPRRACARHFLPKGEEADKE